jgi:hypothetical protein
MLKQFIPQIQNYFWLAYNNINNSNNGKETKTSEFYKCKILPLPSSSYPSIFSLVGSFTSGFVASHSFIAVQL